MIRYPQTVNPHIHSMYLYIHNRFDRFLVSSGKLERIDSYMDTEWLTTYKNHDSHRSMWLETRVMPAQNGAGGLEVITIYRPISGGVIATNIDRNVFNEMLSSYRNYEGELLLVTMDDQVLFSSEGQNLYDTTAVHHMDDRDEVNVDGVKYIVNSQESARFGIRFWSLVPQNILYSGVRKLLLYTGFALLASLVVTFVCAYASTKRDFFRLSRVVDAFGLAEQGHPIEPPRAFATDEYSLLLDNIVRTFLNQSYLKLQLSERKYRLQAARLAALQLQINPHFLFNTLQTIDLEIVRECSPDSSASNLLQRLSELLNYSLESPGKLVSIADELTALKEYCEIQKFRYENRFFIFWDCDTRLLEYSICRLILQPLVENSLYHGVTPKNGAVFIRIKIKRNGNRIGVSVTDNGVGMEKHKLESVRKILALDTEPDSSEHIGLQNTNRRLVLTFGTDSALSVYSRKGLGTVIRFFLPMRIESYNK